MIATAIVAGIIIYGSLYPFNFRLPINDLKPAVHALVDSWADAPSRSDFIANILFYMPFGFCAIVVLRTATDALLRILPVTLIGALLSASMELLQYFDEGRVTAATDLYANTIGTLLGAIMGSLIGGRLRFRFRLISLSG